MYLVGAVILVFMSIFLKPSVDISNTPLSELTLGNIFSAIISAGIALCALIAFFKSFEHDRIWPWRWTLPYVGNLLFKAAILCGSAWILQYIWNPKWPDLVQIIAAIIAVIFGLGVMILDKEDLPFKEKVDEDRNITIYK